jgi:single-strand DNA-binding protein
MAGINRVILIGNLGKDPETMTFENGVKKTSFPLATTESYKNKEGAKVEQTEWHNIVLWRGLAEVAEKYLKKGNQIYLEGKIKTRSWEQDGIKKYITEIYADNMVMLGGRKEQGHTEPDPSHSAPPPVEAAEPDVPQDDLPF